MPSEPQKIHVVLCFVFCRAASVLTNRFVQIEGGGQFDPGTDPEWNPGLFEQLEVFPGVHHGHRGIRSNFSYFLKSVLKIRFIMCRFSGEQPVDIRVAAQRSAKHIPSTGGLFRPRGNFCEVFQGQAGLRPDRQFCRFGL